MAPRNIRSRRRRRGPSRACRLTVTLSVTAMLVTGVVRGCEDPSPDASPVTVAADAAAADAKAGNAAEGSAAGPRRSNAIELPPLTVRSEAPAPTPAPGTPASRPAPAAQQAGAQRGTALALPPSHAKKLAIPAITVESPVMGLGLDGHGRLTAPPVNNPRIVGWYRNGPSPGERGTALVVGHRDTRTGPAIFLNLNALKPGDKVDVVRADRRTAVFTVDKVRTYKKEDFPDAEVYGHTGRPELRLLTCGGSFDKKSGYAANVVVFAHLTDVRQV
ncbi:class F sortase [Streptomyces xantholiticus]